jgi:hypothetical protein
MRLWKAVADENFNSISLNSYQKIEEKRISSFLSEYLDTYFRTPLACPPASVEWNCAAGTQPKNGGKSIRKYRDNRVHAWG